MITQAELKQRLDYNPETGIFTWKHKINPYYTCKYIQAGHSLKNRGHIVIGINNHEYFAHRLAWLWQYGHFPDGAIDHINQNPLDNRLCNLRIADKSLNGHNSKISKRNKTGYKGIIYYPARSAWAVEVMINRQRIRKQFKDLQQAIEFRLSIQVPT